MEDVSLVGSINLYHAYYYMITIHYKQWLLSYIWLYDLAIKDYNQITSMLLQLIIVVINMITCVILIILRLI
jgi:hypothetical protein